MLAAARRAEAEQVVALPADGQELTRAAGADAAVLLDGVTVRRWSASLGRELRLLDDASWEVRDGEHWVVLGPNGAGKTTLMHLAGAMSQPSSGTVEVLGARLGAVDVRALRERIGFVDARLARSLRGHLTGLQTVMTGAFNTIILQVRRLTDEHEERARALMALVSAGELEDRRFEDCSQGERQRLLLARALMAEPSLLLLDEPAAAWTCPGARACSARWRRSHATALRCRR